MALDDGRNSKTPRGGEKTLAPINAAEERRKTEPVSQLIDQGNVSTWTIPLQITVRLGAPTASNAQPAYSAPNAVPAVQVSSRETLRVAAQPLLRPPDAAQPPNQPGTIFEGFAIQIKGSGNKQRVRQIVTNILGPGWTVKPFGDHPTDFEVIRTKGVLSVGEAWEATYRIRQQPGVLYAEPLFAVTLGHIQDWQMAPVQARFDPETGQPIEKEAAVRGLCMEPEPLPESSDVEWSLKQVHVFEAWDRFFPGFVSKPGAGIIVGHPDTGYRRHPEIAENLLIERGYDFVDDDADAEDELEQGPLLNPGHGTHTASVIVSPKGPPTGNAGTVAVTGVAPGAQVIPVRTGRSVITLLSSFNLANAIEYATDQGAHVISMSMGGIFNWRLRQSVLYAQRRGVIVLAAAGNCVRFVVWPAAYDEVIAVAACNARREIWRGSSRGSKVDVTAPGESVWRAHVDEHGTYSVQQGSGTSYAVATAAGAAALWLARHGRQALIDRYGIEKVPFVFNRLLRENSDPMPTWEEGQFGAGILNVEKLLAAALPDLLMPPAFEMQEYVTIDTGGIPTFEHLFEQSLRKKRSGCEAATASLDTVLTKQLATLLRTTEAALPTRLREVGQELAFHLATNPELYEQFDHVLSRVDIPEIEAEERPPPDNMKKVQQGIEVRASATFNRQLSRGHPGIP